MGGHYPEHQKRVHVGTTLTCSYMQRRRIHYTPSQQTKEHNHLPTKGNVSRCLH